MDACGSVDVTIGTGPTPLVLHAGTPDATFTPGGLPSVDPNATPVAPGPTPAAAEIAGLQVSGPASATGAPNASAALASLRGARGTVVAFWATSCAPCQQEIPELQALEPGLRAQGVRLVLVDESEGASEVSAWLRDRGVTLGSWLDSDGSVMAAFNLPALPATAVLGPDGAVRDRILGNAEVGPLRDDLEAMGISAQ